MTDPIKKLRAPNAIPDRVKKGTKITKSAVGAIMSRRAFVAMAF